MKFWVIKSSLIRLVLLMLLVVILLTINFDGSASAQVFFGYSTKKVPIYSVNRPEKIVAISFDAAWGADKTQGIIETLKEYNASATFFLVGFWVDKYPEMVKELFDSGIEIGCHSNTHPDLTKLSYDEIKNEIELCSNAIEKITNQKVELFRCPFGAYNNTVIDVVNDLGMITVQWSVDSLDWKGLSAEVVTARVVENVQNGSIILCHNNADTVIESTTMILDRLNMKGFKVVSIGDLIFHNNYSIDRNGLQSENV